jgi:hypothetical protein
MSVELWAYDDIKCDGYPCPQSCDICPLKDERRCWECRFFVPAELWESTTYGTCIVLEEQPETRHAVWPACDHFERKEDEE